MVIKVNKRFIFKKCEMVIKVKMWFSALDPAGPWFDLHGGTSRLQKSDAKFVDVIHSNQGPLINVINRRGLNKLFIIFIIKVFKKNNIFSDQGRLGLSGQLGQADFFPNGGSLQAGCVNNQCLNMLCIGKNLLDLFKSMMWKWNSRT